MSPFWGLAALPGEFDGVGSIARAHEAWLRGEIVRTGVMVHYVSFFRFVFRVLLWGLLGSFHSMCVGH